MGDQINVNKMLHSFAIYIQKYEKLPIVFIPNKAVSFVGNGEGMGGLLYRVNWDFENTPPPLE